ncbi:hypothetical protein CBR_g3894 [Chara braunii]|uniref:Uncharacterized protein n=1 Tax=Chara braunii TaxID=69332 RepID=A0A388KGK9_CHABU|nr:hypothetical protein CBR_g3894 [Chara braunii]|eukprot:GBG69195.1 hypothetical protein CBR_g3894 [Chara braunii]
MSAASGRSLEGAVRETTQAVVTGQTPVTYTVSGQGSGTTRVGEAVLQPGLLEWGETRESSACRQALRATWQSPACSLLVWGKTRESSACLGAGHVANDLEASVLVPPRRRRGRWSKRERRTRGGRREVRVPRGCSSLSASRLDPVTSEAESSAGAETSPEGGEVQNERDEGSREEQTAVEQKDGLATMGDIRRTAGKLGISLEIRTFGPFFRVTAQAKRQRSRGSATSPITTLGATKSATTVGSSNPDANAKHCEKEVVGERDPGTRPTRDTNTTSRCQTIDPCDDDQGYSSSNITSHKIEEAEDVEGYESESVEVGMAEGWVMPWFGGNILHMDKVRLRREGLGSGSGWIRTAGFFIGAACMRYGFDQRCVRAELLAINDSDDYHRKLVRYYQRRGFKPVFEVTGGRLSDVPHMLVWGGVGTRMEGDIVQLLRAWDKVFR